MDVELALAMGTIPQFLLKGVGSLKNFVDTETCVKPLGIVFVRKSKNNNTTKFSSIVEDVERYTNTHYTNQLVRINNCKRIIKGDKADFEE